MILCLSFIITNVVVDVVDVQSIESLLHHANQAEYAVGRNKCDIGPSIQSVVDAEFRTESSSEHQSQSQSQHSGDMMPESAALEDILSLHQIVSSLTMLTS